LEFFSLAECSAARQVFRMRKVNTNSMVEVSWSSPKGKFGGFGKEVSEELGREPASTDLMKRHPFDVEISRIPPGKSACPFHSHSAQWEFYHVISGRGIVRDQNGNTKIQAGDAFIFAPGEPHELINDGNEDLVLYVVADNPVGESCHYPDSNKWIVYSPERRLIRSEALDYYDGEE
jgi:uncharacterized cupin superfamily protein